MFEGVETHFEGVETHFDGVETLFEMFLWSRLHMLRSSPTCRTDRVAMVCGIEVDGDASSGHCAEDDTGGSAPPLRQVARQQSPLSMRGPWVLSMLIASTSGVSGALGHSGLETPAFLTDGQQWLVGAVWGQSLTGALASEDES